MNWKDEPATENQLGHLRQLGYEPDHPLTKGEAASLIGDLQGFTEGRPRLTARDDLELASLSAYRLRLRVEDVRRSIAGAPGQPTQILQQTLEQAVVERQQFWADTCSGTDKLHPVPPQAVALHHVYGKSFAVPTGQQVQAILDSLDEAMGSWDKDHPELFYQTLELNFPDTLRYRQPAPRPFNS